MSTLLTVTRPMTEWRLAAELQSTRKLNNGAVISHVTQSQVTRLQHHRLQCCSAAVCCLPITSPATSCSHYSDQTCHRPAYSPQCMRDRAISKCNLLLRKDKKMKMTKLVPHRATERQGAVQPAAATAALIAPWKLLLLHPDPGFWCPSQMLICLPFTRT